MDMCNGGYIGVLATINMNKRKYLLIFISLFAFFLAKGQSSERESIIGEWGMCQNWDNPDTICSEPYRIMTFNQDGTCRYGSFYINNEPIPIMGTWSYKNGNIKIKFDKTPNYTFGDIKFKSIIFIGSDLFFSKSKSKKENSGHWSYDTFRKIK